MGAPRWDVSWISSLSGIPSYGRCEDAAHALDSFIFLTTTSYHPLAILEQNRPGFGQWILYFYPAVSSPEDVEWLRIRSSILAITLYQTLGHPAH